MDDPRFPPPTRFTDPMEILDELFEEEFQKFWSQGYYTETKDEDWERQFMQLPPTVRKDGPCPHGNASTLQCHKCYFEGSGYDSK